MYKRHPVRYGADVIEYLILVALIAAICVVVLLGISNERTNNLTDSSIPSTTHVTQR